MAMPEITIKDGNGTNQTVPAHLSADGSYTFVQSRDGNSATYMAGGSIAVANMAASLTDLVAITGSATKIVRVKKIRLEAGATTGLVANITLKKHTVANTGGTKATAPSKVALDSGDAAATAVVDVYTANPTIDASAVTMAGRGLCFTALTTQPGIVEFDFIKELEHASVLRGIAQELAINFGGTTPGAGSVLNWYIVWSEESES
jgi:hypothetical protein